MLISHISNFHHQMHVSGKYSPYYFKYPGRKLLPIVMPLNSTILLKMKNEIKKNENEIKMKERHTHVLPSKEAAANFDSSYVMESKRVVGEHSNEIQLHTWKLETQSIYFSIISNIMLHH